MLSLDKINETILELERGDTTFSTCEKLATCYAVRDHLQAYQVKPETKVSQEGSSEFIQAINGRNPNKLWPIMDELMEAVHILHKGMYEQVLAKIRDA